MTSVASEQNTMLRKPLKLSMLLFSFSQTAENAEECKTYLQHAETVA